MMLTAQPPVQLYVSALEPCKRPIKKAGQAFSVVVLASWALICSITSSLVSILLIQRAARRLQSTSNAKNQVTLQQHVRNSIPTKATVGPEKSKPVPADGTAAASAVVSAAVAAVSAAPIERCLLPPLKEDKLTVVLDLDETLVCAYRVSCIPPALLSAEAQQATNSFELDCDLGDGQQGKVRVYRRPALYHFLHRLSTFADVVLFTAGMPCYAEPLVDVLDPTRRLFSGRLYRSATRSTRGRDHVKDLANLGRDLRRTVLVDNNPYSFLLQPLNGIPIQPFSGSPDDRYLMEVLLPLLESLARQPDVRSVLKHKFQMPAWFRGRGYCIDY